MRLLLRGRISARLLLLAVGLLAMAGAVAGMAAPALANGAPVTIFLNYLPNVSNWGPQDAKGQAVVAVGEGWIKLQAQGLPALKGEHYAVWLEARETRQYYPAGTFQAQSDGTGKLDLALDHLPYQPYRMVLITVESDASVAQAPGDRHTLAGLFPNTAVVQATPGAPAASGAATGESGATASGGATSAPGGGKLGPRPNELPVTGAVLPPPWLYGAALGVAAVCLGLGVGLWRPAGRR